MAINTGAANTQANQLRAYETQLTQAKQGLRDYQNRLSANWQGADSALVRQAIENAIAEINGVMNQLAPLSQDIRNAAEQIRREEEAAAAAARKQAQIRQARAELDAARRVADELKKKLEQLIQIAKNRPKSNLFGAVSTAMADQAAIAQAQIAFNDAAKRADELQQRLNQLSR